MSDDRNRSGRGRRPSGGGRSGGGRGGGRGGGGGGGRGGARKPRIDVEPLHPTTTPPEIESFQHWALGDDLQGAIAAMGITRPTPIQAMSIQPVLEGRDIIAQAETGTGKTLAFGAPMVARVDPARVSVLGLVLCPTRELAEQVAGVLTKLGEPRGISVALIVGGEEAGPQVAALKAGAQLVVGTPGRVLDLYRQKFLSFPWTEFVVLDEADEMLEIGFIDDVREILSKTPDERQTLLFSATFPPELLLLARECTRDPVEVATARGVATVDTIEQDFMELADDDRPLALIRLIEQSGDDDIFLVFCERRTEVERLMRRLERMPYPIKALHGGYDQASRFRVMTAFREKTVKALVATDVASRGLDVVHVTHVINYSVPRDVTAYTHRIGRTGRAGREGSATTFVTRLSSSRWRSILAAASWEIRQIEPPGRGPRRGQGGERRRERGPEERRDEPRPRRSRDDGPAPQRANDAEPPRTRAEDDRPRRRRREDEPDARPRAGAEGAAPERPRGRRREEESERPEAPERPRRRRRETEPEAPPRARADEPAERPRRGDDAAEERPPRRAERERDPRRIEEPAPAGEAPRERRRRRDRDAEAPAAREREEPPRRVREEPPQAPPRRRRRDEAEEPRSERPERSSRRTEEPLDAPRRDDSRRAAVPRERAQEESGEGAPRRSRRRRTAEAAAPSGEGGRDRREPRGEERPEPRSPREEKARPREEKLRPREEKPREAQRPRKRSTSDFGEGL